MQWQADMGVWKKKESEKTALTRRLDELLAQNVKQLEEEREALLDLCEGKKKERDHLRELILGRKNELERFAHTLTELEETAADQNRQLDENTNHDRELNAYLADKDHVRYDKEREVYESKARILAEQSNKAREALMSLRTEYVRRYPGILCIRSEALSKKPYFGRRS